MNDLADAGLKDRLAVRKAIATNMMQLNQRHVELPENKKAINVHPSHQKILTPMWIVKLLVS